MQRLKLDLGGGGVLGVLKKHFPNLRCQWTISGDDLTVHVQDMNLEVADDKGTMTTSLTPEAALIACVLAHGGVGHLRSSNRLWNPNGKGYVRTGFVLMFLEESSEDFANAIAEIQTMNLLPPTSGSAALDPPPLFKGLGEARLPQQDGVWF